MDREAPNQKFHEEKIELDSPAKPRVPQALGCKRFIWHLRCGTRHRSDLDDVGLSRVTHYSGFDVHSRFVTILFVHPARQHAG